MITCVDVVELVTDYLDVGLSPTSRRAFEEHVVICPPCRAHLGQIRRTVAVLGHLPDQALSPEARSELARAFREWAEER